jgi:hypothetical protein
VETKHHHRRRVWALLSVLGAIAVVAALAATSRASAGSGGVYVVTPTWWGWCPGSSVTAVYYFNQTNGASGGDSGDDIVWAPVILNQSNALTVIVKCRATSESSSTYTFIRPTRTGQAWYIGANGGTWHN